MSSTQNAYINNNYRNIAEQWRQKQPVALHPHTPNWISNNGSHQRPSISVLEWIAKEWNSPNPFVYVFTDIKRSSLEKSWGITFSMFDGHVVLGEIKPNLKVNTAWSKVVLGNDHALDCKQIHLTSSPSSRHPSSLQIYREHLKIYAESIAADHCQIPNELLAGDIIVAVDGMKTIEFRGLNDLTHYLRNSLHVSLVLLRHPQVTSIGQRAMQMSLSPYGKLNPLNTTGIVYQAWKQVLFNYIQMPRPVPLTRVVTYDEIVQRERTKYLVSLGGQSHHQWYSQMAKMSQSTPTHVQNPTLSVKKVPPQLPDSWRNPLFKENSQALPYVDNFEFLPDDGTRAHLFLAPINDFPSWILERKQKWRTKYKVYKHKDDIEDDDDFTDRHLCNVSTDFWTQQGFFSFDQWLDERKARWKISYKVYKHKRQKILQEREEIVHLNDPSVSEFNHWLHVRKNQWKLMRRKRQRQKGEEDEIDFDRATEHPSISSPDTASIYSSKSPLFSPHHSDGDRKKRLFANVAKDMDMTCIDAILEEEERQRKALAERPPIDISFLFDANKMAPDDVVVHCFEFLDRKDHSKLLCINKETSESLKARDEVWRLLCPSHWILPRRPRKPWHEIYVSKLRMDKRNSQKKWDDLLIRCTSVLEAKDSVQKVEKLVSKGEADFGFDVDYISPVVCERNCLLNLAVINQRHKVVRWLIDQKGADIESYDRGQFTPLLNAAWNGDRQMVRFLLQRGCNRSKIGFFHSSKPLASPEFKGLTAEGWARKKGHHAVADLIHLGL